ncbi:MAG: hypothetical protein N3D16_01330 [Anaerolineales bacterium]|nr:hypothetical protein [Anaerolineales bacterium]
MTLPSTGFTYQGQLKQGGNLVSGTCDFQFGLYDAATSGNQLGNTQTILGVNVSNGLFTVQLNGSGEFGDNAFDGNARWLAISVRCPGGIGGYTNLGRQALTATPNALYSLSTGALRGYAIVPNRPPNNGQVLKWEGSGWAPAMDNKNPYTRTVIVSPIGTEYDNGQALLDALGSIRSTSPSNPWLLKIEPGVYNLGTATLQMKEFVDIEGSGEGVTIITASGSTEPAGTVRGANNAALRFLTVQNSGENSYAIAIDNDTVSPQLMHVTAIATGGITQNFAVRNIDNSASMTHVTAVARGSATDNFGVYNSGTLSLDIRHVKIDVSDGTFNIGLNNHYSTLLVEDLVITASGGSMNYGAVNGDSSLYIRGSFLYVGNASYQNIGIQNVKYSAGGKVQIDNCKITVGIGSPGNYTIYNDINYETAIGASHLDGGPTYSCSGACPVTCAGVYDSTYTFYANTCP